MALQLKSIEMGVNRNISHESTVKMHCGTSSPVGPLGTKIWIYWMKNCSTINKTLASPPLFLSQQVKYIQTGKKKKHLRRILIGVKRSLSLCTNRRPRAYSSSLGRHNNRTNMNTLQLRPIPPANYTKTLGISLSHRFSTLKPAGFRSVQQIHQHLSLCNTHSTKTGGKKNMSASIRLNFVHLLPENFRWFKDETICF